MKLINPEVRIENSSCCNAKCTICPREKMTRPKVFMPLGHFELLVDEAKELGADTISIFGYGEPLLDKDIVTRVQYSTSKGLATFITTNGSLLDVDLAAGLLDAGLQKIRFSVHGFGDNYKKIHKKLDFEDVVRKITNFSAMNRIRHNNQCEVNISVIPMHGESVEEIRRFWPGNNYKLEIWKPHNWVDGRAYRKIKKKRKKTCGRPFNGPVQINADGNMMVCCFDYDANMIVGNTYKQTIKEILGGDKFNYIRLLHADGKLESLPCLHCDQLNIGDNPLIYSNVDPECKTGRTSSTKFDLEVENGVHTEKENQLSRSG